MSRFFLAEVRSNPGHLWKQQLLTDGMKQARAAARRVLRHDVDAEEARAVCIDTDAGTVTVCWEGRR